MCIFLYMLIGLSQRGPPPVTAYSAYNNEAGQQRWNENKKKETFNYCPRDFD